jgi:optic atrophy 3 protein
MFPIALLIIGETWRTSRNESRRRGDINDQLEELGTKVKELSTRVDGLAKIWEDELQQEKRRCAIYPS